MAASSTAQQGNRSSHPLLGRVLGGRYELGECIGAGGMASVFRARDRRLGRDVAIKVLHPQFATDPRFVERFRREAEFAAGLSTHPHIVTIHDIGDDADLRYIVLEYVPGRNLKDLVRDDGPLPVERAFALGAQIASALTHAHARGLVHRDIKPQNVLVGTNGHVQVTDFGIARDLQATRMTQTGTIVGTAPYMSPEQALGRDAKPASDIYSLGVVLFEMLTGRLPFAAQSPVGVAMQHVHDAPPSPSSIDPTIPVAASALVLRALAKDPSRRGSADDMESTLRAHRPLAEREGTVYRPLGGEVTQVGGKVPRRRAWRLGLLLVPLMLPVGIGAGGWLSTAMHHGVSGAPALASPSVPRPTSAPAVARRSLPTIPPAKTRIPTVAVPNRQPPTQVRPPGQVQPPLPPSRQTPPGQQPSRQGGAKNSGKDKGNQEGDGASQGNGD